MKHPVADLLGHPFAGELHKGGKAVVETDRNGVEGYARFNGALALFKAFEGAKGAFKLTLVGNHGGRRVKALERKQFL